ncbi:MAG: hypothetical protein VST71_06670 [Nitrospirota bacterium]|nr:hypothetical protein [Nitrospirota bacterium]
MVKILLNKAMAERENIRERIRKVNPGAVHLIRRMDRQLLNAGYRGAIVDTTEDMTEDEEWMALFEGFLREGYAEAEAQAKATQWLELSKKL